jgi:hypothetical protein
MSATQSQICSAEIEATPPVEQECVDLVPTRSRLRERGMATAEYAVGILAAVALALVLLKVFNSDGFLKTITDLIGKIIKTVVGLIS